jgi:hypothetical protein
VPDGDTFCPGCKRVLPHSEWHRNRASGDALASSCRTCRKAESPVDYLKRAFGIDQEQLTAMVEARGGVCAMCHTGKPERIDHDNATGARLSRQRTRAHPRPGFVTG